MTPNVNHRRFLPVSLSVCLVGLLLPALGILTGCESKPEEVKAPGYYTGPMETKEKRTGGKMKGTVE